MATTSFTPQKIEVADGDLVFYPNFFTVEESDRFFFELEKTIKWRQDSITLYGKTFPIPRENAWYGDSDKPYTYSGIDMEPEPWTPTLLEIKTAVEEVAEVEFNSVLANKYRNGKDSVAWHSDDEPELGKNPIIASVSFGETRRFVLRHKYREDVGKVNLDLTDGSLLIMKGETQHFWQHQIPKTSRNVGRRINLTFRVIVN